MRPALSQSLGFVCSLALGACLRGDAAPTDAATFDSWDEPCDVRCADGGSRDDAADTHRTAGPDLHPDCPQQSQRAYTLCLWTREADLSRILRMPEARVEIDAAVGLAGKRYEGVELELHGGTSRGFEKKSYRLRFGSMRPSFDFFGDGPEPLERLVLQAAWIDPSFLRNKLVFDVLRELGALAPRVGHARVFLNGEPLGLYQVIERIDENFLMEHGLSPEGNLYKAENHNANFAPRDDPLAGFRERTHEDSRAEDLAELFHVVNETSDARLEERVAEYLHLGDFALWNQVMSFMLNLDTFSKNYYLYHDPAASHPDAGAVFRIIHWDADASLGLWWTGERYDNPAQAQLYGERNVLSRRLYGRSSDRPYLEGLASLTAGPLAAAHLWARADALLSRLRPEIEADLAQWHPETSYEEERAFLKEMIFLREEVMSEAIMRALATGHERPETTED